LKIFGISLRVPFADLKSEELANQLNLDRNRDSEGTK
jgi:hypothetical protein